MRIDKNNILFYGTALVLGYGVYRYLKWSAEEIVITEVEVQTPKTIDREAVFVSLFPKRAEEYMRLVLRVAEEEKPVSPFLLAAIMGRESTYGLDGPEIISKSKDHGLMQINIVELEPNADKLFKGLNWRIPEDNIRMGARILNRNFQTLADDFSPKDLKVCAISAYNAGRNRVIQTWNSHKNCDKRTKKGNYGRAVLLKAAQLEKQYNEKIAALEQRG